MRIKSYLAQYISRIGNKIKGRDNFCYTIDDIEIFILTHNRANLLQKSIESILNQTARVKHICILDNESVDNTKDIVAKIVANYAANTAISGGGGIEFKYIKTTGFLGNFKKAREIVQKPYCMLFHDDDILHPDYLKIALELLNKHSNISLITTRYTEFSNNESPSNFPELVRNYYLFKRCKDFATHMFFIERIAYATAIYRTQDFLRTQIEYERFNKFNDWPFMVKMSRYGNSILLDDKRVFYVRKHSGQDTWTYKNVPNFEQIINWDKIFYDIFKESKDKKLIESYKYKSEYFLKGKYEAFVPPHLKNSTSYMDLLSLAKKMGLNDLCLDENYLNKIEKRYFKFIEALLIKNLIIENGLKDNTQ